MLVFRHTDPRFPFLWESDRQPPARWHGEGEGPTQTFADTPEGAWAELLRHEEIADPEDVLHVRRSLWAVEIGEPDLATPEVSARSLRGGPPTYRACRREAARIRATGRPGLVAPSAALRPGGAHGWRVDGGLRPGPARDGWVVVLFGRRPDLVGWEAVAEGRPDPRLLGRVRPLR
jgi:RES domain